MGLYHSLHYRKKKSSYNSKDELENTHIQQDVEGELKTLKDLYDKSLIPEKVYLEKVSSLI